MAGWHREKLCAGRRGIARPHSCITMVNTDTRRSMPSASNVPPVYLHPHSAANEPVTLFEGPIAVHGGMTGTGRLVLRWQPSTGLRLEADMDSMNAPQPGARQSVEVAGSTAEVLFSSLRSEPGVAGHFARVSGSAGRFTKGAPIGLKDIGFQVVNFNDFFTPGVYATPTFGFPPHVRSFGTACGESV